MLLVPAQTLLCIVKGQKCATFSSLKSRLNFILLTVCPGICLGFQPCYILLMVAVCLSPMKSNTSSARFPKTYIRYAFDLIHPL